MKIALFLVGAGMLACVWGTGIAGDSHTRTILTVGAVILMAGVFAGAPIGAGHARERRARQDYQDLVAKVPVAKEAWEKAREESWTRFLIPFVVLAVLAAWWKGSRS